MAELNQKELSANVEMCITEIRANHPITVGSLLQACSKYQISVDYIKKVAMFKLWEIK